MQDSYGLEVSAAGPAVDAWLEGLQAGFSFDNSGIEQHSRALELAPDFALGHATLARQFQIHGQREAAHKSLARACSLDAHVNEREASQINIIRASMQFQTDTLDLALAHIERWPLDITVFSMVIGPFGLLAFSGRETWRDDCVALQQKHRQTWPSEDWWYQSALAFALAEAAGPDNHSQLGAALEEAEQAWQIKATGNCAHTLSHAYHELDDVRNGRAFLQEWCASYGQSSDMRHHLVWHDALHEFDLGAPDAKAMTALYEAEFDPAVADPMPLTTFSDNASFLWRCCLHGAPLDTRFAQQTLAYAEEHFPSLEFGFAAVHRILVTALLGSDIETKALTTAIDDLEAKRNASYFEQLLTGAIAFTQGDYGKSQTILGPQVAHTVLMGGSNPQRAIVQQTYERAKELAGSRA